MAYRVIYVEKSEHLRLYLDNLKVDYEKDELLVPIGDIQILVIDNYRSNLSIPLINKLTEQNVCTIVCGVDHLPQTVIYPANGNFATSGNIFKQIEWDKERKKEAHAKIVEFKIRNQINVLKENERSFDVVQKMYGYIDEIQIGDATNREGLAAKIYFRALFGDDFIRFNDDVINAGLNYGYAIFRSLISSIIVAKGYLPNLGIFHIGKSNMFNLSDDVIEVFRPIVDNYVYNNMMEDILFKAEHREELIQLTNRKVLIDGRKQTIANAINIYIESLLEYIEDGVEDIVYPLPTLFDYDI